MIYDVIIIGAGAAGLFAGINLDKKLSKLILEKTDKPGTKVLLSGGERANVSNMDIEVERDYFGQNKKALISIFSKFNQWDIQSFFAENGINIIEEDRGRLILESGDSKELVNLLVRKVRENNCDLKLNSEVKKINKHKIGDSDFYNIELINGAKYLSKNVIVSSGGKSFFQVGTTGDGYDFAESFGIKIISPYRSLCGLSTKKNLSDVSGVSDNLKIILNDKNNKKEIHSETGPLLFTHFGLSGPIIFNVSTVIGEYLNGLGIKEDKFEDYILNNLCIDIFFDLEKTPKRLVKFFDLNEEKNLVTLDLQNWRSWKEAKATGGGIDINELDNNMQSKKHKGLYFIGEVVDITGKTGGFNLQWAWSSGFVASENIKK